MVNWLFDRKNRLAIVLYGFFDLSKLPDDFDNLESMVNYWNLLLSDGARWRVHMCSVRFHRVKEIGAGFSNKNYLYRNKVSFVDKLKFMFCSRKHCLNQWLSTTNSARCWKICSTTWFDIDDKLWKIIECEKAYMFMLYVRAYTIHNLCNLRK